MQKDLKIGLLVGLVLVAIAGLWLSTRPNLSPEKRAASSKQPPRYVTELPESASETTEDTTKSQPDDQQPKVRTSRFHIFRPGENLSVISQIYYGSPTKWQKIFDANRAIIKDPKNLKPGTKLLIPE